MKIETGYLYHIKDDFFDKINDNGLMINHENGRARPTYFTIWVKITNYVLLFKDSI